MLMRERKIVASIAAAVSITAFADGPYYLNSHNTASVGCWTDCTKWSDGSGNVLQEWDADGDYYVANGYYMRSPSGVASFIG